MAADTQGTKLQGETRQFKGSQGLLLTGDCYGDPSHPPALLLHGGGQTRHSWSGTARCGQAGMRSPSICAGTARAIGIRRAPIITKAFATT